MSRIVATVMAVTLSISPMFLAKEALAQPIKKQRCTSDFIADKRLGSETKIKEDQRLASGFALRFHEFANGFEDFAKQAFPKDLKTQAKFLETQGPRAALRTMADLLHTFDPTFGGEDIIKELMTLEPDFEKISNTLIAGLLKCI